MKREPETVTAGQFFINRLERLARITRDYATGEHPDVNPLGQLLLKRAVTATYFDAEDFGAGEQARKLLAHWLPGWTPE